MVFINADVSDKVMKVLISIGLILQDQSFNRVTWLGKYILPLQYNE